MPVELIDLKIDYGFKLVFGREGQEPLLAAFLNAILKPADGKQIQSLTYMNTELSRDNAEDKESRLDIRVMTEDKRQIDIEIQLKNEHDMRKRSLYYWAKLYSRQLLKNMAYEQLNSTIMINILDFDYLQETDEFHSAFHLYEEKKQFRLTDALAMHFIELPKLRKKWRAKEVTLQQNRLVRWLFLLDGNENEEIHKQLEVIAVEDPMIERAMKDWENVSSDPQLRELYFDRRKAIIDEMAAVKASELRAERAKAEGEVKGRAEGEVIGETRGRAIMAQDAICQYLNVRFGTESQTLQKTVRMMNDLDTLNRIMNRIFTSNTLDEAESIIQGSLVS
ncbi:MAG: Rpn family recombination-promoting nuclease/putative transposase [Desulfitobacteriaceae bacterium]